MFRVWLKKRETESRRGKWKGKTAVCGRKRAENQRATGELDREEMNKTELSVGDTMQG